MLMTSLSYQPTTITASTETIVNCHHDVNSNNNEERQHQPPPPPQIITTSRRRRRQQPQPQQQSISLSSREEQKLYHGISLIPIDCSFGYVTEQAGASMSFQQMLEYEHQKCDFVPQRTNDHHHYHPVTVVFAIRRPGCGSCREHGRQITECVQRLKKENSHYNICSIGIIKETNVETNGALLEFYHHYYPYPIYKDNNWSIFTKVLGNRKIHLWKLLYMIPTLEKRYATQQVVNIPFGGDIYTQGGVLIFDRYHTLRCIHYETYGALYDLQEIQTSIRNAMHE